MCLLSTSTSWKSLKSISGTDRIWAHALRGVCVYLSSLINTALINYCVCYPGLLSIQQAKWRWLRPGDKSRKEWRRNRRKNNEKSYLLCCLWLKEVLPLPEVGTRFLCQISTCSDQVWKLPKCLFLRLG